MLNKWLYLLGLLLLNQSNFSQSSLSTNLVSLAPVSPNVASLGKYAEIPVGYHTGIPQISIPLYEIKARNLTLPVSLSYHASGIKVEEVASNVGLGWSLNAGGVISRTVLGLPDEATDGYSNQYSYVNAYVNNNMTEEEQESYADNLGTGKTDAQPDVFNYNFGNYSGKFFVAQDGHYYSMPRNNLVFERFTDDVGNYWRVTTEDGTKYNFTLREYNSGSTSCTVNQTIPDNAGSSYETSWFLTSIISADNVDTITFSYNNGGYNYVTNHSETGFLLIYGNSNCASNSRDKCTLQNKIGSWNLSRISFPNGHLDITYNTTVREDLSDTAVQSIAVFNNQGDQIKKYNLSTSYFTANNSCSSDATLDKRLRLDSVQEIASTTADVIPPYKFSYYGAYNMPCRLSNSQDYWGYYNGQSNTTLVPSLFYPDAYGGYYIVVGADRSIDTTLTKSGTLQTITYPTGGTATFDYENNTVAYLSTNFEMLTEKDTTYMVVGHASDEASFQSTSFSLDAPATGYVTIASDCVSDGTIQSNTCAVSITLTWADGTVAVLTDGQEISLNAGTYTLQGYFLSSSDNSQAYAATLSLKLFYSVHQSTIDTAIRVGGLRIRRIIRNDGTKDNVTRFIYNKFDDPEVSTGTVINYPVYYYLYYITNRTDVGSGPAIVATCPYYAFSSTSQYPLATTNGSHVGYSNVQVFEGDESGTNGKTQLTYTSARDYPDDYNSSFPFAPPCSYEWKRGLLIKEEKFLNRDNVYWPVERKINNYTFYDNDNPINRINVPGVKIGVIHTYIGKNTYLMEKYNIVSEWFVLSSDTVRTYNTTDSANFVQTINTYEYNNSHLQLARQTTNTSNGGLLIKHFQYPDDYQNITATDVFSAGVKNLQNNHIVNAIIEQYQERSTAANTNTRIVNGMIRSFKADLPYPYKVWKLEPANPAGTTFFGSNVQSGAIQKSDFYEEALTFNSYDANGNITNQQKTGDMPMSYIWDYNNEYPIAEVKNAALQDIAYNSFEADGTGSWSGIISTNIQTATASLTGKKYYTLNSTGITKTNLTSSTTYIVSYWSKNGAYSVSGSNATTTGRSVTLDGSTWTFYQHTVTGVSAITIAGSGAIDELRLYPATSQMITYTYFPLTGVTSKCDASNRVTYYEYDGLNRLKLVKDQDGNILKTMDYHYHGN